MRSLFVAALIGAASLAAPALADGHSQPATNHMAVYAYPANGNYCPAGLQPVMVGGVICCGVATHHGNPYSHPAAARRTHKPAPSYVQYSKSPSDAVVFEKGQ